MRKLLLLASIIISFSVTTIHASTIVGGTINANTTWNLAGSPYLVQNNIAVMTGYTLTIDPGVIVKFDSAKSIQFFGTLRAIGTASQPITFTSGKTTPAAGDWGYILFNDACPDYNFTNDSGCVMRYCIVEYAGGALTSSNGTVRMNNAYPYINNCIIRFCLKHALRAWNLSSTLRIDSCTIQYNNVDTAAVYAKSGTLIMRGCNISNNNTSIVTSNDFSIAGIFTFDVTTKINNCILGNNNSRAIFTYKTGSNSQTDSITFNTIKNNQKDGIYYFKPINFTLENKSFYILNNTISGNSGNGIYSNLNATSYTQMTHISFNINNNTVINNIGNGIFHEYSGTYSGYYNFLFSFNNNIISNNSANGIYFDYSVSLTAANYCALIFNNNMISNNSGRGIYLNSYNSQSFSFSFSAQSNIILKNQNGGIFLDLSNVASNGYGSLIFLVSKNKFIENTGTGLTIKSANTYATTSALTQNIFAGNIFTGQGGGAYLNILNDNSNIVTNNTFINNSAFTSPGIYYRGLGNLQANKNTIVYNKTSGVDSLRIVYLKKSLAFAHNNIYNNACFDPILLWYDDYNGNTLNAQYNFWRNYNTAGIDSLIWDYFDDQNIALVDHSDFETLPDTAAPVTPVENVTLTNVGGGNVQVTWSPNTETDLAGYKIYWGLPTGYSFANMVDVGNVNTYTISGVTVNDTIVVTAYDLQADSTDDQVEGHESWFSGNYNAPFLPGNAGVITGNSTVCQGQNSVTYTVPLITNATFYTWTLPNGASGSSTTNSIIVNYSTSAVSGNITVTGYNSCGYGTTSSMAITVNPLLPVSVSISASPSSTVCSPACVTFTATPINGGTNPYYYWYLNGTNTYVNSSTYNNCGFANGSTAYCLMYSNAACPSGNPATSNTITLTVNSVNATVSASPSTVCQGSCSTLTATGGGTYQWCCGLGTNASVTVCPNVTTTYTVTVSNNGCSATKTATVVVNSVNANVSANPSSICLGSCSTISASGGGTYQWNSNPPGFSSTNATITVCPTVTTQYCVTVTNNGCTATACATINVNTVNAAAYATPSSICQGACSTISASGGGTYQWSSNPPGFTSTNGTCTVCPLFTTQYCVTVTNNACTATACTTVIANTVYATATSTPSSICQGECTTITATGGGTYQWCCGLGTNAFVTICPTVTTNYTVTVTATNGCTATASTTVTVNSVNAHISANPLTICQGDCSTLTESGTANFQWCSGGTGTSIVVCPATTSSYCITATDINGCSASESVTVTVNPLPAAFNVTGGGAYCAGGAGLPVGLSGSDVGVNYQLFCNGMQIGNPVVGAGGPISFGNQTVACCFTVSAINTVTSCINTMTGNACITVNPLPNLNLSASPDSVCPEDCSTLSAIASGSCSPYVYLWSDGSVGPYTIICPSDTMSLNVTVTDCNGCSATGSDTVFVLTPPNAVATALPDSICLGDVSILTATGGAYYQWNNGLGLNDSVIVSPMSTSTYIVTVTALNGCTETDTVTVYVDPCLGISDFSNSGDYLNIYPNPAFNIITIVVEKTALIEILNINGQLIKTLGNKSKLTTIDISGFSSGVYIIKAKTDKGIAVKRFVKE